MIGSLLTIFSVHFALTALPAAAAAVVAVRLGERRIPILIALALAATGALAMLSFWAYWGSRTLGEASSYLAIFGSIAALAWAAPGVRHERRLLQRLAIPFVLWGLGGLFLVYLGFLHGGTDTALSVGATRFSGQLPTDNDIPRFYGEWIYQHSHQGELPIYPGDWTLSDRPPLQIGYVLAQRPFGWGEESIHYQVLGVILQQTWILGAWALLCAAKVGRVTRALTIGAILLSPVAIVNGFFVWPKMLPAALLLAVAALVLTPLWPQVRRSPWVGALVGALLALALLAHGGSAFGVIPLAVVAALRGLPSRRWLAVGVGVGLALMVPWSAFQKYEDPPGNRVPKWMLAGVSELDSRGVLESTIDSYEDDGVGGTLHHKGQNVVTVVGGGPAVEDAEHALDAVGSGRLGDALAEVRWTLFWYLLPSLGLLLLGPAAMLFARGRSRLRPAEWNLALTSFLVLGVGVAAWVLILFGNEISRTVLHQGSYLLPVLGICGAVCGLRATFPRFAVPFVSVAALLMLAIYTPALTPPPETSYSLGAAVLAALALVGFALVALRESPDAAETVPAGGGDPAVAAVSVPD